MTVKAPRQEAPVTPSVKMLDIVMGYKITRVIEAVVKLGIVDALGDSAQTVDTLAQATNTHPPSLLRLLRFLVSMDVMFEDSTGRFALSPIGATLRKDVFGSVRAWAMLQFDEHMGGAWAAFQHSIKTGEKAFDHIYETDVWTYRSRDLEYSQLFDAAMAGSVQLISSILASYDFSPLRHIIDVGGGNGALLIAILQASPGARGTVFDQPHVVAGAQPNINEAGLADRIATDSGSFFESAPEGGDAYLLSRIIHDWDDEHSVAILKTIRKAMPNNSKLLLIERVVPAQIEAARDHREIMMMDLNMLVMTGGRERTEAEYAALFEASGLKLARIVPTQSTYSVIEAVPA